MYDVQYMTSKILKILAVELGIKENPGFSK